MSQSNIGIDISKDHLDVHCLPDGASGRFANSQTGHRQLIAWLGNRTVARVVYEPTGPYHAALENSLAKAGLALAKVNPRQARRFSEALGKLSKTDPIDAEMLARMGQLIEPRTRPVASEKLQQLRQLHGARQALLKDCTAEKNRHKQLTLALLKRYCEQRLKLIKKQIRLIENSIDAILSQDSEMAQRVAILTSIPGIAKLTAFALVIDMPELGSLEGKQAASLAGLAPMTRQSGKWTGRAFIRGGRARLRRALYMPAMVAIRHNPDLKRKFEQLVQAGKPGKVALIAVMRKLIVLANALLRDNRKWTQKTA